MFTDVSDTVRLSVYRDTSYRAAVRQALLSRTSLILYTPLPCALAVLD